MVTASYSVAYSYSDKITAAEHKTGRLNIRNTNIRVKLPKGIVHKANLRTNT